MPTIKFKQTDGIWNTIYKTLLGNSLKKDKNLSDITDQKEARKCLGLIGGSNTTHAHDTRYYTKAEINNIKNELLTKINNLNDTFEIATNNAISNQIPQLILKSYPVGSYYITEMGGNPSNQLGGGTWVQISGRFLFGADSSHAAKSLGGEEFHTITQNELPMHNHNCQIYNASIVGHLRNRSNTYYNDGQTSNTLGRNAADGRFSIVEAPLRSEGNADDNKTEYVVKLEGSHNHLLSIEASGYGLKHNNMPPYRAVYVWQRTA